MRFEELDRQRQQAARQNGLTGEVAETVRNARETYEQDPTQGTLAVISRIRGFIRHIVTGVIAKHFPDARLEYRADWDEDIYRDLMVMAARLGVVHVDARTGDLWLEPQYRELVLTGKDASGQAAEDEADYRFMLEVAELGSSEEPPKWLLGADAGYFPIMVRYFREIEKMEMTHRVPMSRGTSFCSDLGETAFLSFTHPTFEQLISDLAPTSFLDVGCGEGYQVAAAAKAASVERALGVEMDPEVAASANTRLAELPGAEVRAGNVNSVAIDDEFDLVFGCYMLFYMERDDQLAMLRKVKELLAPDGVFVLCQYFPDFTDFQQVMIENAGGAGIQHYIGDVVNSCIDAEVLLNQILEHFRSGIFWHEYKAMLEEVGFEVSEIRPADPLFYSHYVVARRSET